MRRALLRVRAGDEKPDETWRRSPPPVRARASRPGLALARAKGPDVVGAAAGAQPSVQQTVMGTVAVTEPVGIPADGTQLALMSMVLS